MQTKLSLNCWFVRPLRIPVNLITQSGNVITQNGLFAQAEIASIEVNYSHRGEFEVPKMI